MGHSSDEEDLDEPKLFQNAQVKPPSPQALLENITGGDIGKSVPATEEDTLTESIHSAEIDPQLALSIQQSELDPHEFASDDDLGEAIVSPSCVDTSTSHLRQIP